jgi:hypothetical protein
MPGIRIGLVVALEQERQPDSERPAPLPVLRVIRSTSFMTNCPPAGPASLPHDPRAPPSASYSPERRILGYQRRVARPLLDVLGAGGAGLDRALGTAT